MVRLTQAAEKDFAKILRDTLTNFGAKQAENYRDILLDAMTDLANGPDILGSKSRDDVRKGLRTLHIARRGRRARHVLLYRARGGAIDVIRILHDAMDLTRHASP